MRANTIDEELTELEQAERFTATHKACAREHKAIREAMCLKVQYPAAFEPIRSGDRFAGRLRGQLLPVRFGAQVQSPGRGSQSGYDYNASELDRLCEEGAHRQRARAVLRYWQDECTHSKYQAKLDPELRRDRSRETGGQRPATVGFDGGNRLAGVVLDYDRLLQLGVPGLRRELTGHERHAELEGRPIALYKGMRIALDLFVEVCGEYAGQARELATETDEPAARADLLEMATVLDRIAHAKPDSLREAIQLFWLYTLIAGVWNFGRMDEFLGDFYARDIDSGRLSEAEALELLVGLWQLIDVWSRRSDSRIVIGGVGRRNPESADRFALAAMETTRRVHQRIPTLTLRFHEAQNPALMRKALDVIGDGCVFPILYNDDVNVPAVQKAFGVNREEAARYFPIGCGEYVLGGISIGSPNTVLNAGKAVEAVLHNGKCALTGKTAGPRTGTLDTFDTFDKLLAAYEQQIQHAANVVARAHVGEYAAEREAACWLFISMGMGNCIARGKGVLEGGLDHLGGVVESFGMVNAADSLTAIKQLVYDRKLLSLERLVEILDANFEGHEKERRLMLACPKYGNDEEEADSMVVDVTGITCRAVMEEGRKASLDYFLLCSLNAGAYRLGAVTAASADGRRNGEPFAVGMGPTAGRDRNGITAFLNSIVKPSPNAHAGYVHNMKFTKRMFTTERAQLEALLAAYWANGGTQAMISVVDRGELENAMKNPEEYGNLIVRVGGYSARFVELPAAIQRDILSRTLY